jgi:hypothetical protein
VGFEPTIPCSLAECFTNWQLSRQRLYIVCNRIQHKRKKANIEQMCYGTDDMQQIMLFLRNNTCVSDLFEEVPLCCLLQVLLAVSIID